MKIKPGVVGLFILLVIVPGITWYWLQKGLNYSKAIYHELELTEVPVVIAEGTFPELLFPDSLRDKVLLVVKHYDQEQQENLDQVWRQFSTNPNLAILQESSDLAGKPFLRIADRFYMIPEVPQDYFSGQEVFLVDDEMNIRKRYSPNTREEWVELVQHLAFLVPRVRKRNLSIKRK